MRVLDHLSNSSPAWLTMLVALSVVGCADAPPYQPMASITEFSHGYKDTRKDAQHYFVVYADKREAAAHNFLEVRAAEIARTEGFPYFAFENRVTNILVRVHVNDLVGDEPRYGGQQAQNLLQGRGIPFDSKDLIPFKRRESTNKFYYVSGNVSLLTEAQAKANPGALQVAEILSRPGVTAAR